jgi:hypothetical protein
MGTFSKIKKYSKPSLELDEKIENLDNQIKKTLGEAIVNTTSDVYNIIQYTEPVDAVPPTLSDVPDTSGITAAGFLQNDDTGDNTGYNDTSQLFNNNIGENPTPIIQTPSGTPSGGSGLAWHNITLNGEAVGYIGSGNKFKQVLNPYISGGTALNPEDSSYYGTNYYTEMGLRSSFSQAYQSVYNTNNYAAWKCWIPFNSYGFGAFYNEYTGIKKTDNEGSWGLGTVLVSIQPNKYTSNPGSPYQPGYTTIISRNGLGDPNYYPGPIPPALARGDGKPAPFTEDNYNWYNKIYGLPAAEWYRNNPTKPPSSNPFLPQGAYVPLALGSEIMNKWGLSPEAYNELIAGYIYYNEKTGKSTSYPGEPPKPNDTTDWPSINDKPDPILWPTPGVKKGGQGQLRGA